LGDDAIVEGLPNAEVFLEVEEDGLLVGVDQELKVGGVGILCEDLLPEFVVDLEVEEDGCFLSLGVGEELDSGEC
jgi:hypothetical protein